MLYFKKFITKKSSVFFEIISKLNIKLFITLISLSFLGTSIYFNLEDLASQTITLKVSLWLLGGLLFAFISIVFNAYAWKLLINSIGCNSEELNIIKIFLNTNIYKYFPGGIWHFVSRFNILRRKFSTQKSLESVLLEPLLMLVAGLIFVPFGSLNIFIFILCWSSTLVFLTGLREFIIKYLKASKANIFTHEKFLNHKSSVPDTQNRSVKLVYPYKALLVELVFILCRFSGFLCCMNAFSIGSLVSKGDLIASFSLAWVVGLVVPAAPGGVGVFESVILFGLGSHLPEASLLASLLFYRLISTLSDISAALVYPAKRLLKF